MATQSLSHHGMAAGPGVTHAPTFLRGGEGCSGGRRCLEEVSTGHPSPGVTTLLRADRHGPRRPADRLRLHLACPPAGRRGGHGSRCSGCCEPILDAEHLKRIVLIIFVGLLLGWSSSSLVHRVSCRCRSASSLFSSWGTQPRAMEVLVWSTPSLALASASSLCC